MNRQVCIRAVLLLYFLLAAACSPQEDVLSSDVEPGFALEGMFRYMADAALFRDCRNNLVFPVAMEAQYIELERAYLNSGIEPGSEVMIRLKGRLLDRAAMEGDQNE